MPGGGGETTAAPTNSRKGGATKTFHVESTCAGASTVSSSKLFGGAMTS